MSVKKHAGDLPPKPPPNPPPQVKSLRTALILYLWMGALLLLVAGCVSYASAANRSGRISTGMTVLLALLAPLFALGFAVLLARMLWRRLYAPLLAHIQRLQAQVSGLLEAAAASEKQISRLTAEKLRSQINPHFLHNTLNTVQWLARLNGQKEIDRLVTLLVKMLHYNLGKQSMIVTIGEELESVRNYVELQRIRYDYEFELTVEAEAEVLSAAVPRFLLQPLVENSIYHGAGEGGRVDVIVTRQGADEVRLMVRDNGTGMDQAQMDELLSGEAAHERGLGIGFAYVLRVLRMCYGERMSLEILSGGSGTTVSILIPITSKGDYDD